MSHLTICFGTGILTDGGLEVIALGCSEANDDRFVKWTTQELIAGPGYEPDLMNHNDGGQPGRLKTEQEGSSCLSELIFTSCNFFFFKKESLSIGAISSPSLYYYKGENAYNLL